MARLFYPYGIIANTTVPQLHTGLSGFHIGCGSKPSYLIRQRQNPPDFKQSNKSTICKRYCKQNHKTKYDIAH
jgi:hypothetical protein